MPPDGATNQQQPLRFAPPTGRPIPQHHKEDEEQLYMERAVFRTRPLLETYRWLEDSRDKRSGIRRVGEISAFHPGGGRHHRKQEVLQLQHRLEKVACEQK